MSFFWKYFILLCAEGGQRRTRGWQTTTPRHTPTSGSSVSAPLPASLPVTRAIPPRTTRHILPSQTHSRSNNQNHSNIPPASSSPLSSVLLLPTTLSPQSRNAPKLQVGSSLISFYSHNRSLQAPLSAHTPQRSAAMHRFPHRMVRVDVSPCAPAY